MVPGLSTRYNIKAVPDAIERAIYINCFELLSSILAGALSTFEVDLMGRIVKVKVSEVGCCKLKPMLVVPWFPRLKLKYENLLSSFTFTLNLRPYSEAAAGRDLRAATRFRPNAQTLQQFSTELTSIAPVREVMCNVYSFVLAFAAFSISDAQMTIVGRKMKFRLAAGRAGGGGGAGDVEDVEAGATDEWNLVLRSALNTLVQEMVGRATWGHGIRILLTEDMLSRRAW